MTQLTELRESGESGESGESRGLSQRHGRALLVFGIGCALAFPFSFLLQSIDSSSGGQLVWSAGGDASWIVYPNVPRTTSHPVRPVETLFLRELEREIERDGAAVSLELRCLGVCRAELDGRPFAVGAGRLEAGASTLGIRVARADGPPALSLVLRESADGRVILTTDESWTATQDGSPALPAVRAAAPARAPAPGPPRVPWLAVGVLCLLGVAAATAAERFGARALLLAGISVAWGALLFHNLASLPGFVGFDVEHHLFYLRFLFEHAAIPSPSDGVQTYQPPLFYLLSAGWLRLLGLEPSGAGAVLALRVLTFSLGLWHLLGLYLCVRIVLPGRDVAAALALVFAAAAPLHLALFHAFTNEVLVASLSTAAVWALLRTLRSDEPSARDGLLVGALVGLALLSKLSALVLVPIALGALLVHRPRSAAAPAALLALLAVAGWYYVRVALEFGTPFVGNWDERVGFAWWQDPGVRDLTAYARFGGALSDPWFAGFDSVWDGVYSTFFADGLASGERSRLLGPAWSHGLARAAVWLGLLPALLIVLGAARGVARVWQRPDAIGLALVGLGVAMFVAFVFMTLRVPSYAQAKAIYWSPAFVALFAAFGLGVATVRERSAIAGRAVTLVLCSWAAVSFAVFWIDADAPDTLRSRGERALASGRADEALRHFERALTAGSAPLIWAEVGMCRAHVMAGRRVEAARFCAGALERAPNDPDALFHSASLERRGGDLAKALALLERLRAAAPLDDRSAPAIAALAKRLGRADLVRSAAGEWLRFDPGSPEAIALLAP